jgi:hypothetical protein
MARFYSLLEGENSFNKDFASILNFGVLVKFGKY